jgi:hypothetical protein
MEKVELVIQIHVAAMPCTELSHAFQFRNVLWIACSTGSSAPSTPDLFLLTSYFSLPHFSLSAFRKWEGEVAAVRLSLVLGSYWEVNTRYEHI